MVLVARLPLIVAMTIFAAPALSEAQRQCPTIPESIAAGAVGQSSSSPSGQLPLITDVLAQADLVVRGVLGTPVSYLSDDQCDVLSDYPVIEPVILHQSRMSTSDRPGMPPPIVVTRLGGTVMVGGVRFNHTNAGLPPLQPGAEGLFILKLVSGKYRLLYDFLGAFRISAGKLENLSERADFAPEYQDVSASEALADVAARLQALSR